MFVRSGNSRKRRGKWRQRTFGRQPSLLLRAPPRSNPNHQRHHRFLQAQIYYRLCVDPVNSLTTSELSLPHIVFAVYYEPAEPSTIHVPSFLEIPLVLAMRRMMLPTAFDEWAFAGRRCYKAECRKAIETASFRDSVPAGSTSCLIIMSCHHFLCLVIMSCCVVMLCHHGLSSRCIIYCHHVLSPAGLTSWSPPTSLPEASTFPTWSSSFKWGSCETENGEMFSLFRAINSTDQSGTQLTNLEFNWPIMNLIDQSRIQLTNPEFDWLIRNSTDKSEIQLTNWEFDWPIKNSVDQSQIQLTKQKFSWPICDTDRNSIDLSRP